MVVTPVQLDLDGRAHYLQFDLEGHLVPSTMLGVPVNERARERDADTTGTSALKRRNRQAAHTDTIVPYTHESESDPQS